MYKESSLDLSLHHMLDLIFFLFFSRSRRKRKKESEGEREGKREREREREEEEERRRESYKRGRLQRIMNNVVTIDKSNKSRCGFTTHNNDSV